MNLKQIIFGLFGIFILTGFVLGALHHGSSRQTAVAPLCGNHPGGEHYANHFTQHDPVFFTGVFNVYIEKNGDIGVLCKNGEAVKDIRKVNSKRYYIASMLFPSTMPNI